MAKPPYRILMIDGCAVDCEIYRRFLSEGVEDGYEFLEAPSLAAALDACPGFRPDCVLLDQKAFAAAAPGRRDELRPGGGRPAFAVVLLSGRGDGPPPEPWRALVDDQLVKGRISQESLRRAVHNAIEKVGLQNELAAKEAELQRLATVDLLTGLHNRRYLMERLDQEVQRVRRYETPLSVMMLDLDYFKQVNDTWGHLVGDEVLKVVGQVLHSCLRGSDLAARYGGEEFCVLAASTDRAGAYTLAHRIRQLVAEQTFANRDGGPFHITCSIGVAEATPSTSTGRELLEQADDALYRAKREGRNRVCMCSDLTGSVPG